MALSNIVNIDVNNNYNRPISSLQEEVSLCLVSDPTRPFPTLKWGAHIIYSGDCYLFRATCLPLTEVGYSDYFFEISEHQLVDTDQSWEAFYTPSAYYILYGLGHKEIWIYDDGISEFLDFTRTLNDFFGRVGLKISTAYLALNKRNSYWHLSPIDEKKEFMTIRWKNLNMAEIWENSHEELAVLLDQQIEKGYAWAEEAQVKLDKYFEKNL
jgi:hypothetical protein